MATTSHARFTATHWSLLQNAPRKNALEHLALAYWPPLYAYLRRDGHAPDRAADLTQAFFARLIEKQDFTSLDPAKGKFRTFLLAALKNFIMNQRAHDNALKRGGGNLVSLDTADAETRITPVDTRTPEQNFNRRWALTLLDRVLQLLAEEYADKGRGKMFAALKPTLTDSSESASFVEIAQALGETPSTLRVAAHRLRKRYRELLRHEISQTVASPSQIDDEIRHLFESL